MTERIVSTSSGAPPLERPDRVAPGSPVRAVLPRPRPDQRGDPSRPPLTGPAMRSPAAAASRYAAVPLQNAAEIPAEIETSTAASDPSTDATPLTAHSQGVPAGARGLTSSRPRGKAIPIANPIGARSASAIRIRHGVERAQRDGIAIGVSAPK